MRNRQGSAIVEMAFMLPVLIILCTGMIELGRIISTKQQMGVVANQVAGVLYALRTDDVMDDNIISSVMKEAKNIGKPYRVEQITVRFCEWRNVNSLWRNYKRTDTGLAPTNSGGGSSKNLCNTDSIECGSGQATKISGHGAFVQVTACDSYNPVVIQKLLEIFNIDTAIYNTSYIPMSDKNQTQMLAGISAGGGAVAEIGCSTPDCTTTPIPPDPNACTITSCPAGQQLVGTGPSCSCKVKNNCIGSTLNTTTNQCEVTSSTCPDATYSYNAAANRCAYAPKCQIVSCGASCATYKCDDCKPPSMLLASSGACVAFPVCPASYTYDYTVSKCTMANGP